MIASIHRLFWRLLNLKDGYHELNRRAAVEQQLWLAASGKTPMPDRQQLREWALQLGVPSEFRRRLPCRCAGCERARSGAPGYQPCVRTMVRETDESAGARS